MSSAITRILEYHSADQVLSELKNRTYKPVYLLHGEESFFIDTISDFIEHNALSKAEQAFNQVVLYGRDVEFKQIYDEARQYPMMSERRVVILKEAQDFKSLKEIGTYISNPSSHTVLVICHKNRNIDGRISWVKDAKKSPFVVMLKSESVREYKLQTWVNSYLKSRKRKISPQANLLLCEYLGTDLKKLVNEIDKVEINLPSDKIIEEEDIEKYVGISKTYNVFELLKALCSRDNLMSHRITQNLAENIHKNPIQMIIPAMLNHFQKVYIMKRLPRSSDGEYAKILKVSPYHVKEYKSSANQFSEVALRSIFKLLKSTDSRSKGVDNRKIDNGDLLKDLVMNILLLK